MVRTESDPFTDPITVMGFATAYAKRPKGLTKGTGRKTGKNKRTVGGLKAMLEQWLRKGPHPALGAIRRAELVPRPG
jgi:hypothetical protein